MEDAQCKCRWVLRNLNFEYLTLSGDASLARDFPSTDAALRNWQYLFDQHCRLIEHCI
jgi:hypothetical protein